VYSDAFFEWVAAFPHSDVCFELDTARAGGGKVLFGKGGLSMMSDSFLGTNVEDEVCSGDAAARAVLMGILGGGGDADEDVDGDEGSIWTGPTPVAGLEHISPMDGIQ
jgi:hypothetical protein